MNLTLLDIQRVRNLVKVTLNPASGANLIFGENASGKTTLLESVYVLAHARSFRTHHLNNLIQNGNEEFKLFAELKGRKNKTSRIGIQRSHQTTKIRIDQTTIKQVSELAARMPLQIINPATHNLIEQGPTQRRKFIDWGLFHVEQNFLSTWHNFHRILKQRNAALRSKASREEIEIWNTPLADQAEVLTLYRTAYLDALLCYLNQFVGTLLSIDLDFTYYPGWRQGAVLEDVLTQNLKKDRDRGFTAAGPQRAELKISLAGMPAQEALSRGQQKLLVSAMRLAQIAHLKDRLEMSPIILVDDLAAELDQAHRTKLLELLQESGSQVFLTVTEKDLVSISSWESCKVFHVEHGHVSEVV
ncbi:MAG: DNA replication/repair protein RecF [Proteobacteria bacterium]|jgi:DNA replication and repair protein RecF|nr:DNA replication/repair protein RecF [Pseudomonadota bacterium]